MKKTYFVCYFLQYRQTKTILHCKWYEIPITIWYVYCTGQIRKFLWTTNINQWFYLNEHTLCHWVVNWFFSVKTPQKLPTNYLLGVMMRLNEMDGICLNRICFPQSRYLKRKSSHRNRQSIKAARFEFKSIIEWMDEKLDVRTWA